MDTRNDFESTPCDQQGSAAGRRHRVWPAIWCFRTGAVPVEWLWATSNPPATGMQPHAALISGFYAAFQRRDHDAMGACYAPDATFRDPVFQLHGWRVPAMWRMLCERGTDLQITFSNVTADDSAGMAEWEARYSFSATRRPVHNRVRATFRFRGAQIIAHRDDFSLWRWSAQAIGGRGLLLGWTPPVRRAIRRQAAKALEIFILERGLTPGQPAK